MNYRWHVCFWLSALLAGSVAAAEPTAPGEGLPPEPPPPPPEHRHMGPPPPNRRFRSGPGVWQAFSQLTPEERREMLKLQREDPEKFHELMRAKADELFRKREARRNALRELAEKCRNATEPAEKEKLRQELTAEIAKDFRAHLEFNRRQLEEMKRRTARLEAELQRREKNRDQAIAALVEAMISGKKLPPPPDSHRFDRKPLEK